MVKKGNSQPIVNVALSVKRIILDEIQNNTITPAKLLDSYRLKEDLGYTQDFIDFLCIALNKFIKKQKGKPITPIDLNKCKTVGETIVLVKSKIP